LIFVSEFRLKLIFYARNRRKSRFLAQNRTHTCHLH